VVWGDGRPRPTAQRRARRDAQHRPARPSRPRRRSGARRRRRSAAPCPTSAVAARPPPPPQPCGSSRGLRHCRGSRLGHQGGHRGRHRRHPAVTPPPRPRTPRRAPSPPPPFSRGRRRYRGHDRRRGLGHRGHLRHGLAAAAAVVAAVPAIVSASGTTTAPRPPPPPPLWSPPLPPPPPPPPLRAPSRPTCGRRGKGWAAATRGARHDRWRRRMEFTLAPREISGVISRVIGRPLPIIQLEKQGNTTRIMRTDFLSNERRLKRCRWSPGTLSASGFLRYSHPRSSPANQNPNFAAILLAIGTRPCIWIKDGLKDQSDAFLRNTC